MRRTQDGRKEGLRGGGQKGKHEGRTYKDRAQGREKKTNRAGVCFGRLLLQWAL